MVAGSVGTDDVAAVGRGGQAAGVEAGEEFRLELPSVGVDDAHGAFAGDAAIVDTDDRATARGPGEIILPGAAAAPVADVGLAADEDHVVRRDADVERAADLAV